MPDTEDDFQAEMDLRSLKEAKDINDDPSRLDRARGFATRKAEELTKIVSDLPKPKQRSRFSGARRS